MELRSLEAGASIAYYSLFSMIPLIIFLISVLGSFLEQSQVQAEVLRILEGVFPVSQDEVSRLIFQNVEVVVQRRSSVGVVATLALLWAGSNVFTVLARNINGAWHIAAPR